MRDERGYCFRYSTDSFHLSEKEVNRQSKYYVRDNPDLTYKIQGNCIFTSIENGNIEIAYEAINVDKDGYPFRDIESKSNYISRFNDNWC